MTGKADSGKTDRRDRIKAMLIAIALIAAAALALALIIYGIMQALPPLQEQVAIHFAPGLGLKSAAVISFFITVALLLIFIIASGDGGIGELPFVLVGFFLFFLFFWLMIAWIF